MFICDLKICLFSPFPCWEQRCGSDRTLRSVLLGYRRITVLRVCEDSYVRHVWVLSAILTLIPPPPEKKSPSMHLPYWSSINVDCGNEMKNGFTRHCDIIEANSPLLTSRILLNLLFLLFSAIFVTLSIYTARKILVTFAQSANPSTYESHLIWWVVGSNPEK